MSFMPRKEQELCPHQPFKRQPQLSVSQHIRRPDQDPSPAAVQTAA